MPACPTSTCATRRWSTSHLDNLRFWLNRGVDGFRFDAVGVLFENSAAAWENQPENHQLLKRARSAGELRREVHGLRVAQRPGALRHARVPRLGLRLGCKHIVASAKLGRLRDDLLYSLRKLPVPQMATLLANHDYFAGARRGSSRATKAATAPPPPRC